MTVRQAHGHPDHAGTIRSIDGLKGLGACIIAFAWHYQHFSPQNSSPFYSLLKVSYDSGWTMVELFFFLSGFCMMRAYGDRITGSEISFSDYMGRRIRKVYPLFILSTGIVLVLQILYISVKGSPFVYPNFDVYHLVLNVLLLQNGILETGWSFNSPSWCISICIWLYALLFLVCRKTKKKGNAYLSFFLLGLLGGILILLNLHYPLFNALTGRGLAGFSAGALFFGLTERITGRTGKKLAYGGLILLAGTYALMRLNLSKYVGNLSMVWILALAPGTLLCALYIPWVRGILSWKPVAYLGRISIGIYLLHFPVQLLIVTCDLLLQLKINYSGRLFWIIYVGLVLSSAALYDLPARKKKRKGTHP